MNKRQEIAIEIGLQTHILKSCPAHRQIYLDDDVDPAGAFALAIELVRKHKPFVRDFEGDEHALTDLLSDTLGTTPDGCPECLSMAALGAVRDRGSFVQSALEIR
jgi:hypothetical protein